jgi:hypothetical protein
MRWAAAIEPAQVRVAQLPAAPDRRLAALRLGPPACFRPGCVMALGATGLLPYWPWGPRARSIGPGGPRGYFGFGRGARRACYPSRPVARNCRTVVIAASQARRSTLSFCSFRGGVVVWRCHWPSGAERASPTSVAVSARAPVCRRAADHPGGPGPRVAGVRPPVPYLAVGHAQFAAAGPCPGCPLNCSRVRNRHMMSTQGPLPSSQR